MAGLQWSQCEVLNLTSNALNDPSVVLNIPHVSLTHLSSPTLLVHLTVTMTMTMTMKLFLFFHICADPHPFQQHDQIKEERCE